MRKLIGPAPFAPTHAVTKAYVDALAFSGGSLTAYTTPIGNGSSTSIVVTHNLGTRSVLVSVHRASTYEEVDFDLFKTSVNTVTLAFAVAPATNSLVVTVISSGASLAPPIRSINSISTSTTLGASANTDYFYFLTASGGVPTLPSAVSNTNLYVIKNTYTAAITVFTTSSQTIDGSTTRVLQPAEAITVLSDNANWNVI